MKFLIEKIANAFSKKPKTNTPAHSEETIIPEQPQRKIIPPYRQRYYYAEKKRIGNAYESEVITKEKIISLITLSSKVASYSYSLSRKASVDFNKIMQENELSQFASNQPYYKNVEASKEDMDFSSPRDGIEYCYLPPNMQFYDEGDALTHFIAVIENECEICSTEWCITSKTDENTNARVWYDTVGQYKSVTNTEIIQKIENTLVAYKLQQEALLKIMEPMIEAGNAEVQKAKQRKRNKFEAISKELSEALSIIGVSKERYDELVEEAFEEDDNHIGELLVLLSEDDNYTYLDWKTDLEDVHFCLNEVAKKQNIEEIPEDGLDFEKELFCEDALRYLKSQFDKHVIYTIDVGADGLIAGILDNETGEKFIEQMNNLFEKKEFKKEGLKIEKL